MKKLKDELLMEDDKVVLVQVGDVLYSLHVQFKVESIEDLDKVLNDENAKIKLLKKEGV